MGIRGRALVWIRDFLRNRCIQVKHRGSFSKRRTLRAGVPQGSVLSPLLFILYTTGLSDHLSTDTRVHAYADDIALRITGRDIAEMEGLMNSDLDQLPVWGMDQKLIMNPAKSQVCLFTTNKKKQGSYTSAVVVQGTLVEAVRNPVYLGVTLDPELRFGNHISNIAARARKKLNIIKSLAGSDWGSRASTLRTSYCAVVRPHLEYAIPVWGHAADAHLRKLDVVQTMAARLITGAVRSTPNITSQHEAKLQHLQARRDTIMLQFGNRLACLPTSHLCRQLYDGWTDNRRLKRSSPLQ
jgi:hypothetical protein